VSEAKPSAPGQGEAERSSYSEQVLPRICGQIARGFAMGSADIVPGVSGGTVALVLGIYNDLISNIRIGAGALGCFVKGDISGGFRKLKTVEWVFLIPLAVGVLSAVAILTSVIEGLLESSPVEMAGLFFGLILASIVVAWRLIGAKDSARLAIVAVVGLVMFTALGFRDISTEQGQASVEVATASGLTISPDAVLFEHDTAELTDRGTETLDDVASDLSGMEITNVDITGRTDASDEVEPDEVDAVAMDRARVVSEELAVRNVDVSSASLTSAGMVDNAKPVWLFFLAGAFAICAMILPGISGSLILVLLAMYQPLLAAAHDRDILRLFVFLVGATIGLAVFSQLLHWLLEHYHDTVIAVLIGLMVGSLRILWPWPQGIDGTDLGAPGNPLALPILLAVGAGVGVLAVSAIADRTAPATKETQPA